MTNSIHDHNTKSTDIPIPICLALEWWHDLRVIKQWGGEWRRWQGEICELWTGVKERLANLVIISGHLHCTHWQCVKKNDISIYRSWVYVGIIIRSLTLGINECVFWIDQCKNRNAGLTLRTFQWVINLLIFLCKIFNCFLPERCRVWDIDGMEVQLLLYLCSI